MQSHIIDECDLPGKISKIKQCILGCKPQADAGWVYRYVGSPLCYTLCVGAHAWDAYDCIDTQLDDSDPINLGIKVPVGDLDLWLNGGTQSSNCNRHNYFGDMVCSHVEPKLLFGATMRKNCHIAHKCHSYRKYKSGRCERNKISLVGWNLHPTEPIKSKFPNNYYMDTEFTSGDYCEVNNDIQASSITIKPPQSKTTPSVHRELKAVKEIKQNERGCQRPRYPYWCLGMSWFGLCKAVSCSDTKATSESITTKNTAQSTTVPSITIQSTVEYETTWAQRSTLTKRTSPNTLSSSTASRRWYDKTTDIPSEYETVWTPRSTIEQDTTTGSSSDTALEYKTEFTPTEYTTVYNFYTTVYNLYLSTR